ncbi:MAG TPA: AAA family ATPase [Phycisphaerales bacterium]|nr:AAA family ATPase [Phycisphaerales bacterium]
MTTVKDQFQTIEYAKRLLSEHPQNDATNRIELGIAEIRTLVGEVLDYESAGKLSPSLARIHGELTNRGIEDSLAIELVQSIDSSRTLNYEEIRTLVIEQLLFKLPRTIPPPSRADVAPAVIALVGPTGVGKTTTIAKLATAFRLQQGRSVAFITADTYRVAAVEQMSKYADLFDAKLEVVGTAEQMKEAMKNCCGADVILIDTAGRSVVDGDRIEETAKILEVAKPTQTHIVLSAATSITASRRAIEGFSPTNFDRILVTKLDEAVTKGEIISTLCFVGSPLSWCTNGQDIATHIEIAKSSKLVDLLFQ